MQILHFLSITSEAYQIMMWRGNLEKHFSVIKQTYVASVLCPKGTRNPAFPFALWCKFPGQILIRDDSVTIEESEGPFTRSDFKDPILSSENWKQARRMFTPVGEGGSGQ